MINVSLGIKFKLLNDDGKENGNNIYLNINTHIS